MSPINNAVGINDSMSMRQESYNEKYNNMDTLTMENTLKSKETLKKGKGHNDHDGHGGHGDPHGDDSDDMEKIDDENGLDILSKK